VHGLRVFSKSFEMEETAILLTTRITRNAFIITLPWGHDK
jgi:hypothetical protein